MASLIFSHRFKKGNRKGTDLTWLLRYNHLTACHLERCFDRFPDRLFLLRLASVCLPLAFPPTLYFYIIAVQNNSAGPLTPHICEDVRAGISEPPSPCRPDLSSATFQKHDLKCQLVPATLWGVTVMSSVSTAAGITGRVRSRHTDQTLHSIEPHWSELYLQDPDCCNVVDLCVGVLVGVCVCVRTQKVSDGLMILHTDPSLL